MKTFLKISTILFLAVFLTAGSSIAAVFGDGGAALQGVLDGITVSPVGSSSVDVTTDEISDSGDSIWGITATGTSAATLIIELAGYAGSNRFGIYDAANPGSLVQIFDGAASPGFIIGQATVSIALDGQVAVNNVLTGVTFAGNAFGYYLYSPEGLFRSDTALNPDGVDHMFAYQGGYGDIVQIANIAAGEWTDNEFILAFEDLYGGGDRDYTDFVVMVESVSPIPEPTTILLSGLGLLGIGAYLRRRFKKA